MKTNQTKLFNYFYLSIKNNLFYRIVLSFFIYILIFPIFSQAQWIAQSNGTTNPLYSVYFTDANTGYAVGGSGTILKTINGGSNWTTLLSGTSKFLTSVYFTDANTGYVVGESGTILKTTNGGPSWTAQSSGTNMFLGSIYFTDSNTGYAAGFDDGLIKGVILKTTDGGSNWTTQFNWSTGDFPYIYFTDANTGYMVGDLGILKTINGGSNWTTIFNITLVLYSVYFIDANTGYVGGGGGTILKTVNGGNNWTAQTSGTTNSLYSVYFTDANTGFAVGGSGTILKTINGGINWTAQTSGTTNILRSVYFTEANTGYAVGDYGTILKYTGIITQTQTINTLNDTLHFNTTGIVMTFDSTSTTLPIDPFVTITHHESTIDTTSTLDSVATVFNNFFWDITSNIDTFETNICFKYDTLQLNTSAINNLSLVYQEQSDQPWSLIQSTPIVNDSQICFITDHWSNWAIAITKPEERAAVNATLNNTTAQTMQISKTTTDAAMTLGFELKPGEIDTVSLKRYDINPGGDLPAGITEFLETFWEVERSLKDTTDLWIDIEDVNGYDATDSGKYSVLYRPDAGTDWSEIPTYRVKKGLKEKCYIKMDNPSGHFIVAKTSNILNYFNTAVTVANVCKGNSTMFLSQLNGAYPPYSFSWSGEDGFSSNDQNPVYYYPSGAGQYNYRLVTVDNNGVTDTINGMVEVFVNPMVNLGKDTAICNTCTLLLDAGISNVNYQWSTSQVSQIISVNQPGIYSVTVSDLNNCKDSDTIKIDIISGVSNEPMKGEEISIFPMPVNNILTLNLSNSYHGNIITNVLNVLGQSVKTIHTTKTEKQKHITIDLSELRSGVYFLQINMGGEMGFYKLQKGE